MSSTVDCIVFNNIRVNGEVPRSLDDLIYITSFADINEDGRSTGEGHVGVVYLDGQDIKSIGDVHI